MPSEERLVPPGTTGPLLAYLRVRELHPQEDLLVALGPVDQRCERHGGRFSRLILVTRAKTDICPGYQ